MPAPCTKKTFTSIDAAKRAHRKASYRIRVYRCESCGAFHVTNDEKNGRARSRWQDQDEVEADV